MNLTEGQAAFARRTYYVNGRVESGEGHAHVRGMRRDTLWRGSQNRVNAVETLDGVAAASRCALVAAAGGVVKIIAASTLHDVAAGGCHVAKLGGGAIQDRFGKQ
jgi:hypothetical protein